MDLEGKNIRVISGDLDGDAENIVWAEDNQSIYFTFDERGIRKVGKVTLTGKLSEAATSVGDAV